jgi:hypothetical protein
MAEGGRYMRDAAKRMAPEVNCDLFTPICWWFRGDCDGDHRTVQDANSAYRIQQLGQFPEVIARLPETGEAPDVFYTLYATRAIHAPLTLGVAQDTACSMSIIYTGPESGPERYETVARRGWTPRSDPSGDPRLGGLRLDERPLAFAILHACKGAVLLAHANDYSASADLEHFARKMRVKIIRMPLSVMAPALIQSIQRRIFVSIEMRWSKYGNRIGERAVNWRIPSAGLGQAC